MPVLRLNRRRPSLVPPRPDLGSEAALLSVEAMAVVVMTLEQRRRGWSAEQELVLGKPVTRRGCHRPDGAYPAGGRLPGVT